jgi:hypothetical protein
MAYLVTRRIGKHLYRYEVESYWDSAKKQSRQRILRFVGRVDSQGKVVVAPAVRVDSVSASFPVGPLALFYAMARELRMVSHIETVLDVEHNVAVNILCLVLNQIGAKRPLAELPAWVARSPIPRWEQLQEPDLSRESFDRALHALCHATRDGGREDLGLALQHEMTGVWRGGSREPAQFYYDVTRQIYHGGKCEFAEPGYFPGGTKKNVLGFGMVTSRHNQHPVLCRAIQGSRNDTVTVQDTVNHLKAWGFKKLTLIVDRGMISRENVEFVVKSGFDLVGLVPETHKEAWTYITRWSSEEIEQPRHIVERASGAKVYIRDWKAPLLGQKKMRVALVVDKMRATREQLERDGMLQAAERTTDPGRLRELREELGGLAVTAHGRRGFEVDEKAVKEDRCGDGKFLMFSTNPDLGAEEMFKIYFQRDEIEKAFRTLKGELSLGPIRYHRRDRIDAYTTIIYLAYLLWSLAQQRLREKYPSLTVTQALKLVGDIHAVRFQSGKRVLEWTTKRTMEQNKIIKLVGALDLMPSD